jgi:hypothetical protein
MPDRQACRLDALLKALPKSKEHAYRKAVTAEVPIDVNAQRVILTVWCSPSLSPQSGTHESVL